MNNKVRSTLDSGGNRGIDVRFSLEDFSRISNLFEIIDDPANLVPAKAISVRFKEYKAESLKERFRPFKKFESAVVSTEFNWEDGEPKSIVLMIHDPSNSSRTVLIAADAKTESFFVKDSSQKDIEDIDDGYIKDLLLCALIEPDDTHTGDFTFNGLYEFFKLLHPARVESYRYATQSDNLLDGYLNPEDLNFAKTGASVLMVLERRFGDLRQAVSRPVETELNIDATIYGSVLDSFVKNLGNLHMNSARRIFSVKKGLLNHITIGDAYCTSNILMETNRVYGKRERVVTSNLENQLAESDAQPDSFLGNIENAISRFVL